MYFNKMYRSEYSQLSRDFFRLCASAPGVSRTLIDDSIHYDSRYFDGYLIVPKWPNSPYQGLFRVKYGLKHSQVTATENEIKEWNRRMRVACDFE